VKLETRSRVIFAQFWKPSLSAMLVVPAVFYSTALHPVFAATLPTTSRGPERVESRTGGATPASGHGGSGGGLQKP